MGISINIQRITRARARRISDYFSTVDLFHSKSDDDHSAYKDSELSIFLEGAGHEDCAARIVALINEQVIRRDRPAPLPYENSATIPGDELSDGEEAAFEQERQEEEQAESARRELEADEYARAFPKLRDREERADDDLPF
jgi:FtsZ-interacting cell division protein YlmF